MESRYLCNDWTHEQQLRLGGCQVSVIGCGGIGGHVAEMLARAGVGKLVLADGDYFEFSNLNRQRFARVETLGGAKADAAARELAEVNPEVVYRSVNTMLTEENGASILAGSQAAVDALDNVPDRLLLQSICEAQGIPLVHGAVSGWQGQAITIYPGDHIMERLYPGKGYTGSTAGNKSTPFAPALIAAIEAAEVIKILLGEQSTLRRKLLTVDMLSMETRVYML